MLPKVHRRVNCRSRRRLPAFGQEEPAGGVQHDRPGHLHVDEACRGPFGRSLPSSSTADTTSRAASMPSVRRAAADRAAVGYLDCVAIYSPKRDFTAPLTFLAFKIILIFFLIFFANVLQYAALLMFSPLSLTYITILSSGTDTE